MQQKACIGMNVVTYLDNDSLNKPNTGGASVYAVNTGKQPVTQTELIELYPQVFKEGEYHIRIEVQREHYALPTIEEIATRLYGAKCFVQGCTTINIAGTTHVVD